ncbi:MAG: biotin/lipoyl-binding protein [Opitutales bacterium]|nr:biotin/lipoyl-binding protein [Opitutales bacterium]
MKYQVIQGDAKHSVNIEGKYDFAKTSPIEVDKNTYDVKIEETDLSGSMKTVMINHRIYRVSVKKRGDGFPEEVILKGVPYKVDIDRIESTRYRPPASPKNIPGDVSASMPGQVINVLVNEGESVEEGQAILILEAMKMENEILAPKAGKLKSIASKEGTLVMKGDLLFEVE